LNGCPWTTALASLSIAPNPGLSSFSTCSLVQGESESRTESLPLLATNSSAKAGAAARAAAQTRANLMIDSKRIERNETVLHKP
jgi:hypothetical protein